MCLSPSDHGRAGAADGRPAQQVVPVPGGRRERARDPRLHRPQQALPLLQRSVVLAARPPPHPPRDGRSGGGGHIRGVSRLVWVCLASTRLSCAERMGPDASEGAA